jgi:hypothetical protein
MDEQYMLKIVGQYHLKSDTQFEGLNIVRVPDFKTVFVEQIGGVGRSIILTEYRVDGKKYWAGYSTRSQTVFISRAA